jgi:tetratricopeptide (TPR) repeat protein
MRFRRRLLIVGLFVLAACAIAGAGYWLAGAARARRSAQALYDRQLTQVDKDLSLGYFQRAADGIGKALRQARSEHHYLRLLKRAYQIASATGDFSSLHSAARRAVEKLPGSRALRLLLVFSLLRLDGEPGSIPSLASLIRDSTDAQNLVAEAALRGLSSPDSIRGLEPQLQSMLAISQLEDPVRLQEQGITKSDGRIALDAALLWMQQGDVQSAHAAVAGEWTVPVPLEPRAFIAFDAGNYEECAALIDRLPGSAARLDLQLIKADALRALKREPEAAALYQQVISGDAQFSWTPYLNLARIADHSGEKVAAGELRRKAFELFPESGAVLLDYGRSLYQAGESDLAVKLLRELLKQDPQNAAARYLLLQMAAQSQPAERYQAQLWSLFGEHPDSPLLCRVLAQQLLAAEDAAGAAAALDRFQFPTGDAPPAWLLELRGLTAALGGDYDRAAAMLSESYQRRKSWRIRYNLAIVYRGQGNLEKSINELLQAGDELRQASDQGDIVARQRHSRIRSLAGELMLRMGKKDAARRESEYALELDPGNGQALLVLRMLEGK